MDTAPTTVDTSPAPAAGIPGVASSPSIGRLVTALAKARAAFPAIEKDKTADTGKYKYDYSDLATILAATSTHLSQHGLAVTQPPRLLNGMVVVTTVLAHESGEWMASELVMPVLDIRDPQKVGSAISYARRYGYCAALGIATGGEDDDAEAARTPAAKSSRRSQPAPEPERVDDATDARPITKPMLDRLRGVMREHGVDERALGQYLKETYGYEGWAKVERKNYEAIVALAQAGGPRLAESAAS